MQSRRRSEHRGTVAVAALRPVLIAASLDASSVADVLEHAGLPNGLPPDAEARVPDEVGQHLWATAVERTGNPDLALDLVAFLERMFPLPVAVQDPMITLRYAVCDGGRVRDAFDRIERTWRFVHDAAQVSVEADAAGVTLRHRLPGDGPAARHLAEMTLGSWLAWIRRAAGAALRPEEIAFAHARPDRTAGHERFFDAPLRFDAACDAIRVSTDVARTPLTASAPPYPLEPSPEALLWHAPQNGLLSRARAALASAIAEGSPNADAVAERLRMSRRTYYRRLRECGTSHGDLLDALRHELAVRWLSDGRRSVDEIALRLGYSESSPFLRAFRRWTGTTPGAFRRSR
jgi:AraC-like DNA-binding protein